MQRKTVLWLLAFIIVFSIVAVTPLTALAGESLDLDVNGGTPGDDYTYADNLLTILTGTPLTISGSTNTDRIVVEGGVNAYITLDNVSIIQTEPYSFAFKIDDGSTGDVSITLVGDNILQSSASFAGLGKSGTGYDVGTLTISGGGSLTAIGGENGAGIGSVYGGGGSDNITIDSTTVTATGGSGAAGIGGGNRTGSNNIVIKDSTVTAMGGTRGAGIGSGDASGCGNITIDDSYVEATGGETGGSGIGGGKNGGGGNITITNSTIIATAGGASGGGAGIGSGAQGSECTITISGSTVTATGWGPGAGIGGGNQSSGGTITINSSTFTAIGGDYGAGIGGGQEGDGGNITISGGIVTATGGPYGAGIGGGRGGNGGIISINGGIVTATGGSYGAGIGGGRIISLGGDGGNVTVSNNAVVFAKGDAATGAKDIGRGNGGSSDEALSISDTAAVFLYSGTGPAEGEVTCGDGHTLSGPMNYTSSLYGIALPGDWSAATGIGAYLRLIELSYDANGGGGALPAQLQHIGTSGTIQTGIGLSRTSYAFSGWNTQANGNGDNHAPNDSFTFNTDTTLYAKWTHKAVASISLTAQSHIYDGTAKAFAITGSPSTGFTIEYYVGAVWTETPPTDPGHYNVRITRAEDETYAAYASGELSKRLIILAANVIYYDAEGTEHTAVSADLVTSETTTLGNGLTQWFVVEGNVTINSTLTVSGSVNLILADGAFLTVNGSYNNAGVNVTSGNSLTIYGQENGTGSLMATGNNNGAGIGSAPYYGSGINSCGTVIINGGNVTALGVDKGGAGIGGGTTAHGGNVTINGGTVYAEGYGAGIGGGKSVYPAELGGNGGTVTINGGTVTAVSKAIGAGIGGGGGFNSVVNSGAGATVTISGDAVVFARGKDLKDIGSGGSDGTLSISDTAAVFLYGGAGPAEGEVTCGDGHTLSGPMNYTSSLYGIALPGDWSAATGIGAYLRLIELSYDANGGGGALPAQLQHIGTSGTIQTGNGLSHTGYTFDGWNTQSDGDGTDFDPGESYSFNTNTVLYAKWVPEEYTIAYTLNDGELSDTNPISYTVEDTFTLNNPTRTGYTFAGWTSEGYLTPTITVTIGPGTVGNLSYTANWTANDYTVSFEPEGGTVSLASINVAYASAYGTLPTPTKAGYTFAGWWTGEHGTGTQITAVNTLTTAASHTLYAKWTDKAVVSMIQTPQSFIFDGMSKAFSISGTPVTGFTVTYNQGEGSITPVNPGSYNVQISRAEDETYAQFNITIENGLVINAATIDISEISGVTAPVRGAAPVGAINETEQFTGTVTWEPAITESFAASTEYKATIILNPKTGYTMTGVTADFFTVTGATSSSNAADSDVITAVFPATGASSSGGGSGGGVSPSSPITTDVTAQVTTEGGAEFTLPVTVDANSATASVDTGFENPSENGTTITIPFIPDVDTYIFDIPVTSISTTGKQGWLTLDTAAASVCIPSNMLTGVAGSGGSRAQISIGQGDKNTLTDNVKVTIGDKPLISLSLTLDGKRTDWNNSGAQVTVSIPYTPTSAELANPEAIVVWYIDGSGNPVTIPSGRYDAATGTVTFNTTHFSNYAVAYNNVSFSDVSAGAWYNKAVSFIAAREITSGTGDGSTYSPEAKLTRGEFIVLMMRAYGFKADAYPTDNFSDAGDAYYTGYLAAAKRLGISTGTGNNMYAPDKQITRQEMFTLLYNTLKVIGLPPDGNCGKSIYDFSDADQISSWAKEAMILLVETGIISGNGEKLTPADTTTRAEMAQVLYNLLRE